MEGDVTPKSTQRHQVALVVSQSLGTFAYHVLFRITSLILWDIVDILSWGRPVFVYRLDIFRVCRHIVHPLRSYGAK